MKASTVLKVVKKNNRILRAAEKRVSKRKPHKFSNADQIRYLAVLALKTAKGPLSLHMLTNAFRDVLKFKIRSEYLLMELLCKRERTGIVLLSDGEIRFELQQKAKLRKVG